MIENEVNQKLLLLLSNALKNISTEVTMQREIREKVYEEASAQAVLPLVVFADQGFNSLNSIMCRAHNIHCTKDHCRLHELMSEANIPYTIIKGVAAASYYPDPGLRSMGDVDFLINKEDIDRTTELLTREGFKYNHDTPIERIFLNDGSVWELHWEINGVPYGKGKDLVHQYLDNIISDSVIIHTQYGICRVNNRFHHGLVILLHMSHHMMSSGMGLRHLCDWAVFTEQFSEDEFQQTYQEVLESIGLWKFACLMSAICHKYLGTKKYAWINISFDDSYLEEIYNDILGNGNFGIKNPQKGYQGKLLLDTDSGKVRKNSNSQLLERVKLKSYRTYNWSKKYKILLPVGMVLVCLDYLKKYLSGQKDVSPIDVMSGTQKRKKLYEQMELFEVKDTKK